MGGSGGSLGGPLGGPTAGANFKLHLPPTPSLSRASARLALPLPNFDKLGAGHPRPSCAPLRPIAFEKANDYSECAALIPSLPLCEEEYEGTGIGRDGRVNMRELREVVGRWGEGAPSSWRGATLEERMEESRRRRRGMYARGPLATAPVLTFPIWAPDGNVEDLGGMVEGHPQGTPRPLPCTPLTALPAPALVTAGVPSGCRVGSGAVVYRPPCPCSCHRWGSSRLQSGVGCGRGLPFG